MNFSTGQQSLRQLQALIWAGVWLIVFLSLLAEDGFGQAFSFAVVNVAFYAVIIYGNITLLYPLFFEKGRKVIYFAVAGIFVALCGLLRGIIIISLYNNYFAAKPQEFSLPTIINFVAASFLIYLLSFVFRIAIAYYSLKEQSEKILSQKSQAELELLKSRVQPHFLFNTLNNIYYKAYKEAPEMALLVEKLADMMRYFVDESVKEVVSIQTEIEFLNNYIALESIRIRHGVNVGFQQNLTEDFQIPPMLLMTFVENIFKHGIDKSNSHNNFTILLEAKKGYLYFATTNSVNEQVVSAQNSGFGLSNLRKRLSILYGDDYEMKTEKSGGIFEASLKLPIK